MNNKKFVVKLSIECYMIQTWLSKDGSEFPFTEHLTEAAEFDTVKDAHKAMAEYGFPSFVLGYQVIFKGLCRPNPF